MSASYRYPGVKPFEATDEALFFGRARDRADLRELVNREQLTVLFGKSGYGKSSLIKAGLMPDLFANPNVVADPKNGADLLIPNRAIYIRLNLYGKSSKAMMPCDALLQRFREQVGPNDADENLRNIFREKQLGNTLWNAFKWSKCASEQRIFLIFDQFEEFFSYPPKAQAEFKQQISELLYTRIPQVVRDEMEGLEREHKRRLHQVLDVRVMFAIRSDRIHLLNSMREELPAILQTRYELQALSEQQAQDAIVKPAQLSGSSFLLKKPFEYEPAALSKILSELNKAPENFAELEPQSHIEAFQLQMVCQTIEQKLIAQTKKSKGEQPVLVKETDLPDFGQIYEQYYTDKLADLPDEATRHTAHILLEEEMVIGADMTSVRRVSMDKDLLKEAMLQNHQMTVTQELLDYLEDKFLIRRETIGGHVHYEVSHDVLLTPLMKAREEAREREAEEQAKSAAEQRVMEAETRAHKDRIAKEYAEKRRRRARLLSWVSAAGFVLAAIVGAWAWGQKSEADEQKRVAQKAFFDLKKAEDERIEAEKETKRLEFHHTLNDIEIILKSRDGCPDEVQIFKLKTLPGDYPDDSTLQKRVNDVKAKIITNHCPVLQ